MKLRSLNSAHQFHSQSGAHVEIEYKRFVHHRQVVLRGQSRRRKDVTTVANPENCPSPSMESLHLDDTGGSTPAMYSVICIH